MIKLLTTAIIFSAISVNAAAESATVQVESFL